MSNPRLSDILAILPVNALLSAEAMPFSAIGVADEEAPAISIESFRTKNSVLLFIPCRVAAYKCNCSREICKCPSLALVFGMSDYSSPVACLRVWLAPPAPPDLRAPIAAVWSLCAKVPSPRIAIVGSRKFAPLSLVSVFVAALPPKCRVISGAAPGVDSAAAQAARQRGLEVEEIPAQWWNLGRRAGMARNADIVKNSDILVAFWDGASPGTQDAIKKARRYNVVCFVVSEPPDPNRPVQAPLF